MDANYVQRGESINYVNPTGETITAGTIVVTGKRAGVAGCDIAPGKLGSLHTVGVFNVKKANPATEFAVGAEVYYSAAGALDAADSEAVRLGWAVEPSTAGYADLLVKID